VNTADFLTKLLKASRTVIAMACMAVFHSVAAYSDAPSPETFNKSAKLILNLPDEIIKTDNSTGSQYSFQTQNLGEAKQLIAGAKKNTPLNVDCGMDVYQNTGPDISLSSRLTGECDLKYKY